MNQINSRAKWSGPRMQKRLELAAERRSIRQEPSAIKRRTRELAIARKVVKSTFLERESELARTTWVAYGYLSPLERTEGFCEAYLKCYRRYYAKYRDMATSEEQKPIDPELLKNDPREINSFWHARQTADDIGMPYDMYLNAVMEWATSQKNRKEFPRPNQLYSPEQAKMASETWERMKGVVSLFEDDWDDRFFKQNPVRDAPRLKAIGLVIVKLKERPGSAEHVLASLIGSNDALSETEAGHIAGKMFPDRPGLMSDVARFVVPARKSRAATTFEPYLPPCLGMRDDVTSASCTHCQFTFQCQKARVVSGKLLQTQTGSSDPLAATKREQHRIRQRRKRAKDRAARGQLVTLDVVD